MSKAITTPSISDSIKQCKSMVKPQNRQIPHSPRQASMLALTLGVGCTDVNQGGPLQASTLTLPLMLGGVIPQEA